jgi:hypothetical protein
VADRETGARLRLQAIIDARNARMPERACVMLPDRCAPDTVSAYIQPDPRGAALYILRPGDVPAGASADSYYPRGLCVH